MSAIGPDLPPHLLAKRKRQQAEEEENASTPSPGAKGGASPEQMDKRRRVMGPAMPPAPLSERPTIPAEPAEEGSDDSDDDYGPALPGRGDAADATVADTGDEAGLTPSIQPQAPQKLQRDDWMMVPPKQDDLAARMDPSKPRPRAFNAGRSARSGTGPGDGDNSAWHETPEQKRKRLEDEMMGITKEPRAGARSQNRPSQDATSRQKAQDDTGKSRGPSLLEQHQRTQGSEVEDDPSRRAFDREKDMASGSRISSSQRAQLVNKAADFGSKFSKGGLL